MLEHPGLTNFLFSLLTVWPLARILRRAGLNPVYAGLVFIPVAGLVSVLLVLSLHTWPTLPPRPRPLAPKRRREA